MEPPDDASDLRGFYVNLLMRRPLTWVAIAVAAVAGGTIGTALGGAAIGLIAAGAALLLALLAVFAIAGSKAEGAFFEVYAAQREMTVSGKGHRRLPPATPLLRKGDDRYAEPVFSGPLADGIDGVLALYTYEEESSDGDGHTQTSYHRYTIGMTEVPECIEHLPELFCQRKSGLRALEKLEDVFRRSKQRVKLESEALDERYEIFSCKEQDQIWLRELFSPTFIVWLSDSAPDRFAFELVGGTLCCYVNGHKKSAAELDAVRAASATVATRLREESLE
jgi:hypothetical protein